MRYVSHHILSFVQIVKYPVNALIHAAYILLPITFVLVGDTIHAKVITAHTTLLDSFVLDVNQESLFAVDQKKFTIILR